MSGPIRVVEGSYPWLATEIDLASVGYVEEEYFMEGAARTYDGSEVTGESPYKTRLMVRRPISEKTFSGVVVVEWMNVSANRDAEPDWSASHEFFTRSGWTWVGVSAQVAGVVHLKRWNNDRYGSLNVSDDQSADIFAQAAKALSARIGSDPMEGLSPEVLIASGKSQSAGRVGQYYLNQQENDGLFDGFLMVANNVPRIANVLTTTKALRIQSETDVWHREVSELPPEAVFLDPPDSDYFRTWEVAGTSHAHWKGVREAARLVGRDEPEPVHEFCVKTPYSKIPFHHAQNAAYYHLERWIRGRGEPPVSPRIEANDEGGSATLQRDERGFAIGGIRLPEHVVPTALQTGENAGMGPPTGTHLTCIVAGSREPLSHEDLMKRYPDLASYVRKIDEAIKQSLREGFLLRADAKATCLKARRSQLGWTEQQPRIRDRECWMPAANNEYP